MSWHEKTNLNLRLRCLGALDYVWYNHFRAIRSPNNRDPGKSVHRRECRRFIAWKWHIPSSIAVGHRQCLRFGKQLTRIQFCPSQFHTYVPEKPRAQNSSCIPDSGSLYCYAEREVGFGYPFKRRIGLLRLGEIHGVRLREIMNS